MSSSEWDALAQDVLECKRLDALVLGKANSTKLEALKAKTAKILESMNNSHRIYMETQAPEDLSDEKVRSYQRYTDGIPLKPYENALDLVPELVNLVSLADAYPLASELPFDLNSIALNTREVVYFAPRRFTAVQLAFDEPRSRVLLFHTGRVVGTGCNSPMSSKLAVARALKIISTQGGVHVHARRFSVINQVGAVGLGTALDCHAFADTHSLTAHYDPKSFVGLAWRPVGEPICSEIYSTGKSNLPGSRRERQLLRSFSRMAPELLRHTKNPDLALRFDDALRAAHKPEDHSRLAPRVTTAVETATTTEAAAIASAASLWDDDFDFADGIELPSKKRGRELDDGEFDDIFDGF